MTINELLLNDYYRGNQSLLAKDLNVNRSTLKKYMDDKGGKFHFIKQSEHKFWKGNVELFTNQSNKVSK